MTLADLIAGGESLTIEFKRDANDHELVETVVSGMVAPTTCPQRCTAC